MQFSIITPSFRNSRWLQLCISSVADQDVELEHLVQDACSDDGTLDWLPKDPRVMAFIEKDRGMYDAVNRGLRRSKGEILAYINCDEQYLPGALRSVMQFFDSAPEVDVVFADTVVINTTGEYICHRKALLPGKQHTRLGVSLTIFTCATFFRRKVIDEHGLFFDPKLRDLGDVDWVMRLINRGIRMATLRVFTSAFTKTGSNMNLLPNAHRERAEMFASAPLWTRKMNRLIEMHMRVRRLLTGGYFQSPFEYSVYTEQSAHKRFRVQVTRPTSKWPAEVSART